ncbi:MAG: nitrous oxide reductase family maturation protein NosD [Myxococcales bacterium]|nr:nitrous oxide reductase family maturation protein NosD [Myxococcales bacterium]
MKRGGRLGAALLLLAIVASFGLGFARRGAGREAAAQSTATKPDGVGPIDQPLPDGAVVADDESALTRLVKDPAGPAVIGLDARVYEIDLEIKRPLTLVGRAGAIIQGTGTRTVVTIDADDVHLENVVVRRSGKRHTAEDAGVKAKGERVVLSHVRVEDALFGIALQLCPACVVEKSHVIGRAEDPELRGDAVKIWESDNARVSGCFVEDSRDIVVWYARHVTLEDNLVTRSRYGSHFMYAHDSTVRRSRIVGNVVGVFVMYSSRVVAEDNVVAGARGAAGIGFGFKESDDVELRRNYLVANTVGAYLDQTPRKPGSKLTFDDNVLALNDVGLRLHGSEKGARFHDNDFHENASMVELDGAGDALGVEFRRNHFSDYEGYDLDRDGFGDVAYQEKLLSSELTNTHPSLRFFHATAAMSLLDAVAHAVPVLSAKVVLTDPSPRVARAMEQP